MQSRTPLEFHGYTIFQSNNVHISTLLFKMKCTCCSGHVSNKSKTNINQIATDAPWGLWLTQPKESIIHSGLCFSDHLFNQTKQTNKTKEQKNF